MQVYLENQLKIEMLKTSTQLSLGDIAVIPNFAKNKKIKKKNAQVKK